MLGIRSVFASPVVGVSALRSVIAQKLPEAVVRGERNASVKQLRLRVASVKSIQRITKTMKMVAAAKLKGFQTRMVEARPLGDRINYIVSQIPPAAEGEATAKELKHILVPITSDRGLCGGVNGAVAKQVKALSVDLPKETDIFVVGNKGETLLKRTHASSIKRLVSDCYKSPTSFALASEIAEEIAATTKYDKATIIFNQFKSAIAYNTLSQEIESADLMIERMAAFSEKYEFDDEFCENTWMADMMQFCLASKVYSCLLEAATSETSARMQAMENATKNCGEMITKLTLQMNKARQAVITAELGEIVSGAAAVSEGK
eukprot:CAMPEP_0113663720 /NCGR_PEP_ID=MMETSP0038_2-20120614/1316_1 /TAXON_ID=2898 /ORGANISM="Cryptomonas paramecium" /LENGTH=318 /DNA_ID=CAMNT_0000578813 /DNA_START=23 /DNA_END=979 /DNA_ORIENTATION=+ /assembly_acc=CAM_ASM_000170